MAITLSVTYTPNYEGNHRICFRTTGTAYCCYNDDSTSVVGVPKTTIIDLEDYELCLQTLPQPIGCAGSVVDGYVQPICIEQGSDINRVTFSVTYESTQCTPYNILCNESGIGEITVTDPGYGWLPLQVPTVDIIDSSGYGSGAIAEAVMLCDDSNICHVDSILIIEAGQGYYFLDQISVVISPPPGLGGTDAVADVTLVDQCPTFTITDCDGTPNATTYQLWGGAQYAINVCSGAAPDAAKYVVTPNPPSVSCCDCFEYQIVTRATIDLYYTDCNQGVQTINVAAGLPGTTICCVRSSIFPVTSSDNQYILSITEVGPCTL